MGGEALAGGSGGSIMLAMEGEALARKGARGETARAGGLNAVMGAGVWVGVRAGEAVSKAERMGSKF